MARNTVEDGGDTVKIDSVVPMGQKIGRFGMEGVALCCSQEISCAGSVGAGHVELYRVFHAVEVDVDH